MEHYLDNAATTKPCAEAAAAVMSCISSHYGNPSSLHRKGLEAQHEVEYARNQVAGALYIRQGVRLKPVLYGSRQEKGLRPGTEGVPVIAAFGAAAEKLVLTMDERYDAVSGLRSSLIEQLKEMDGVIIRDLPSASPYVLNISLLGYRSEIVLHYLEQREVYISSGSACSKGASSGVLELFGAKPAEVDSALRISFCSDNTEEDIAALVQGLKDAQKDLMH